MIAPKRKLADVLRFALLVGQVDPTRQRLASLVHNRKSHHWSGENRGFLRGVGRRKGPQKENQRPPGIY
jgi:hypothetical protein